MPASSADQACRECRRRKGKCDFKLPVCSACQRYRRHCLYDKHSRSALTRKHLTEVEERLERAEALLRTVFNESELAERLAQNTSTSPSAQNASNTTSGIVDSSTNSAGNGSAQSSSTVYPKEGSQFYDGTRSDHDSSSKPTLRNDDPNQEDNVPSAADEDFEWDERDASWTSHEPTIGQTGFSGMDEYELRKITDGMATLTANASNTGFLGTVSGAALLRQISGYDKESDTRVEIGDERRNSIIDFLAFQMHETSPSPSSWLQTQPIMTRAFADTLVDLYFAYYHPTFPILHEASFRQQYQHLNDRPKSSMLILANLVAALGSFATTDSSNETDVYLFNAVKSQLTIESLETGSLSLVQAFAMAATYLQKRNRPNSGYNYGGVALRLAISLGLHKEFRGWNASPLKKEIRRRVWWSLCILDVGATITYGRPLNWPQAGVEAHLPLNVNEQDLQVESTTAPPETVGTTPYTYVKTQSAYHLATIPIYYRLISSPLPSAQELTNMDDDIIEKWRVRLPAYFSDTNLGLSDEYLLGHAISRWRFRIMRIVMYRPFFLKWVQSGLQPLRSTAAEDDATSRCLAAAEECITVASEFWSAATHTRLAAWYVLYFLMQALLIPVHCIRRVSSHAQLAKWVAQVHLGLEIVNTMTDINSNALRCKDIVYKLCGRHLMAKDTAEEQQFTYSETFTDLSSVNAGETSADSWMTELDTAINQYDMSCDRLTRISDPINNISTGSQHGQNTSEELDYLSFGLGPEVQDWDLGLMLMQ